MVIYVILENPHSVFRRKGCHICYLLSKNYSERDRKEYGKCSKLLTFGHLSEENSLYDSCNFSETEIVPKSKYFLKELCY